MFCVYEHLFCIFNIKHMFDFVNINLLFLRCRNLSYNISETAHIILKFRLCQPIS